MITSLIEKLVQKENLSFEESVSAMTLIMEGEATPSQFGSLITALRMKGETVDEVSGMASVMRAMSLHVDTENDLVDRYYQAVKGKSVGHILRLPADNPIPDPTEYNRLINYHLKTNNDFSSNICNFMKNGYPDGFGVEIFTVNSLKRIWRNEKRKKFREHITLNFYDYKKNGRRLRVEDLNNAINYFNNSTDSVSQAKVNNYKKELKSIEKGTGFNWYGNNTRRFSAPIDFDYRLKVIDILSDSVAVAEVTKLDFPFVIIRDGDLLEID